MATAQERKQNYILSLRKAMENCQSAINAAEDIDVLDISTGEKALKALDLTVAQLDGNWVDNCAFKEFCAIFFPKGSTMRVHLRADTTLNEVEFSGSTVHGKEVCYYNASTKKFAGMYIGSLLGWGLQKNAASRALRAEIINKQLGK